MWSQLRLTVLVARYRAEVPCSLPRFKGPMFRGAFGYALRELACVHPDALCERCPSASECAYGSLFEAGRPENVPTRFDRPLAYILRPPSDERQEFQAGDTLELRIALVGSARKWLPWVIWALAKLGYQGLAGHHNIWTLDEVVGVGPDQSHPILRNHLLIAGPPAQWTGEDLVKDTYTSETTLQFLTPTLLETKGRHHERLNPSLLCKRLLRRAAGLAERYCSWSSDGFEFQPLVDVAEQIRCDHQQLQFVDWQRFSTRQKRHMPFAGFLGKVTLCDIPDEWWPYIALGQWLHVGRRASFGMGAYELASATTS